MSNGKGKEAKVTSRIKTSEGIQPKLESYFEASGSKINETLQVVETSNQREPAASPVKNERHLKPYFDENTSTIGAFSGLLALAGVSLASIPIKPVARICATGAVTLALIVGRELWEGLAPYHSTFRGLTWFVRTIVITVLTLLTYSLFHIEDEGVAAVEGLALAFILLSFSIRRFQLERWLQPKEKHSKRENLLKWLVSFTLIAGGSLAFWGAPYLSRLSADYIKLIDVIIGVAFITYCFCIFILMSLEIIVIVPFSKIMPERTSKGPSK